MGYVEDIEELERQINSRKIEKARLEERMASLEGEIGTLNTQIAALVPPGQKPEDFLAAEEAEISKGIKECQAILGVPLTV